MPESEDTDYDSVTTNTDEENIDILDNLAYNGLTVTYPEPSPDTEDMHLPIVSQENEPSQNIRSNRNKLLATIEILNSYPTPSQAAIKQYPLKFVTAFAGALLDKKTGKLLEYRHLIQRPKYKKDWGFSFGSEV